MKEKYKGEGKNSEREIKEKESREIFCSYIICFIHGYI
jgi:hypothetical protein